MIHSDRLWEVNKLPTILHVIDISCNCKKTWKILCKQVFHKCVDSCAQFVNQNGFNSQLAIGLGRSQWSNLNSKYLSGKCPDSFIICVQGTPDLLLRCEAWVNALRASSRLRAESWMGISFSNYSCISDLGEKITLAGYERHTKGNNETSFISCPIIYLPHCGVSQAKMKIQLNSG